MLIQAPFITGCPPLGEILYPPLEIHCEEGAMNVCVCVPVGQARVLVRSLEF